QANRRKNDVAEAKAYYMEQYGVPESWFEGTFEDSVIVADSIYSANLDMDISDVGKFKTGAELIIFDECFNGSFQKDRYIAGEYVFGDGNVIAGVANSVNVKQDVWTDEGLGLLDYNVRLGQWHQKVAYLENHIIGDPTFRFYNPNEKDWAVILEKNADNLRFWKKTLKSDDVALRSLAVRKIVSLQGVAANQQLVDVYQNENSFIVRLSTLKGLAGLRTPEFEKILFKSVNDPYELIRRFTVQWMGVVGREDYLPVLVRKVIDDPSDRVTYLAKGALEKIAPGKVYPLFEKEIQRLPAATSNDDFLAWMKGSYERSTARLREETIPELTNDTLKIKTRIGAARTMRNYQYQEALPVMISVALDETDDAQLRIVVIEALGWYAFAFNRDTIIETCDKLLEHSETPADVKNEALKTRKRIIAGYTDPVNP
ncbi:MAG: HEAT repeat domain-containing protein, partial [Candidatus Marinimicrobia bacterium]|nr:HEAT repeat domain-containing protein [Candidatus Neomarinimicrobiota bacterium]